MNSFGSACATFGGDSVGGSISVGFATGGDAIIIGGD